MRLLIIAILACSARAQSFTLDQILSAPFPSELTASPDGAKAAWVSNSKGVRNIRVAGPPDYRARAITNYTEDDGQEISALRWLPDASAIVYVRGTSANPALNPAGPAQHVWIATLGAGAPR